ncbi:3-hydroxyacyl-ACP dehydratase FabZ family protein [Kitasatospora sp. P5_F3]
MYEYAAIRRAIPHRHPVLLVDRVVELDPFERIVTTKTISGCEPCYAGMADDLPQSAYSYPRSLLIESFGQSGAVLWMESVRLREAPMTGTLIFAVARKVVFHRSVYPGDTVRHVARVDSLVGPNAFLSGESYVGDELVATVGEAIAVMRETDALGPGADS